MINKYIFLGIKLEKGDQSILGSLWSKESSVSFSSIDKLASLEQMYYISFIRTNCQFKPWKTKIGENCVNDVALAVDYFLHALEYFKEMANIVFSSYEEFYNTLIRKLSININRQKDNY